MVYEKLEKHLNIQNVNNINKNYMLKSKYHPNWFSNTPVYYEGNILCFIGSTKNKLEIDLWLYNHPFYNKESKSIDIEGRIDKFNKKYKFNLVKNN